MSHFHGMCCCIVGCKGKSRWSFAVWPTLVFAQHFVILHGASAIIQYRSSQPKTKFVVVHYGWVGCVAPKVTHTELEVRFVLNDLRKHLQLQSVFNMQAAFLFHLRIIQSKNARVIILAGTDCPAKTHSIKGRGIVAWHWNRKQVLLVSSPSPRYSKVE